MNLASLFICFLINFICDHAFARYTARLRFLRYQNPSGRDNGGSKCEGSVSTGCDTYFQLCVVVPANSAPRSFSNCVYEKLNNQPRIERNDIDFQTWNTGIDDPVSLGGVLWPSYIGFYMKVYDYDRASGDDLLDTYSYRKSITPGNNGTRNSIRETINGLRRTSQKTYLSFSVEVFCLTNYYGSDCNTYCKYQDDANGHYRCSSSGGHICLNGWFNKPKCLTNCVPFDDHTNGHYTCSNTGSHVCRNNWYNLPDCTTYCMPQNDTVNGHYACSDAGRRICHHGWHGDRCTVFCIPRNDTKGHFKCSSDGTRLCYGNWYGDTCTTYCKASNNDASGFYNCSSDGDKVCLKNYYGINCTEFCLSNNTYDEHFICDPKTGEKKCLQNWMGSSCNVSVSSIAVMSTLFTVMRSSESVFSLSSLSTSIFLSASDYSQEATITTEQLPSSTFYNELKTSYFVESSVRSSTANTRKIAPSSSNSVATESSYFRTEAFLTVTTSATITPIGEKTSTIAKINSSSTTFARDISSTITPIGEKTSTIAKINSLSTTVARYIFSSSKTTPVGDKTSTIAKTDLLSTTGKYDRSVTRTREPLHLTTSIQASKSSSVYFASKTIGNSKTENVNTRGIKWFLETDDGKIVLGGSAFAVFLLIAVAVAVAMYIRSPRGSKPSKKIYKKSFKDTSDEFKIDDLMENAHINPLYEVHHSTLAREKMLEQEAKRKHNSRKYDVYYVKPHNMTDLPTEDTAIAEHDDSNMGVFQNPLYGISSAVRNSETGV